MSMRRTPEIEVTGHGGECCGIYHLYNFWNHEDFHEMHEDWDLDKANPIPVPPATLEEKVESIRLALADTISYHGTGGGQRPKGLLVEAVLSDCSTAPDYNQFKYWERALQRYGFRKRNEFKNSNTGNTIRVYHYVVK